VERYRLKAKACKTVNSIIGKYGSNEKLSNKMDCSVKSKKKKLSLCVNN
jgi:hypothetical protein